MRELVNESRRLSRSGGEGRGADQFCVEPECGVVQKGAGGRAGLQELEGRKGLFGRLVDLIPSTSVKIAESVVLTPADVAHYRAAGADAVLIGEALVTGDPVATLHAFLEAGS